MKAYIKSSALLSSRLDEYAVNGPAVAVHGPMQFQCSLESVGEQNMTEIETIHGLYILRRAVTVTFEDARSPRAARSHITNDVFDEMERQDKKWGEQNHSPLGWLAILTEEVGEVAKEATRAIPPVVDQFDAVAYRKELVQVAAVAMNAIESLDRQEKKK